MNKSLKPMADKVRKNAVKILWYTVFGGIGFVVLLVLLINFRIIGNMPPMEDLENPSAALASVVLGDDGYVLGKYYEVDRSNSEYKDISPNVIKALIATEETRFYENSGIDAKATAAIPFYLLKGDKRGSSTITQQLALNLRNDRLNTTRASNILARGFQKLEEWIVAIKLERNFTKQEILTLYLNTVAFGDNVYGIENGARTFFSKSAATLTISEAAVLVGMLKGTTLYNPRRNPREAMARRNTVIENMLKENKITAAEAAKAKAEPIVLKYNKVDHNKGLAPYFREVLRDELKQWCKTHTKADGSNYNLSRDGLRIYTTINPRMQLYAEESVAQHLKDLQKVFYQQSNIKSGSVWKKWDKELQKLVKQTDRYRNMKADDASEEEIAKAFNTKTEMEIFSWIDTKNPEKNKRDTVMTPLDSLKYMRAVLQAGFMAMDPESGEVKAWVGGPNFFYFKNDHVKNMQRQVGSTFKPFLYTFAVMSGISPNDHLPNEPIVWGNWRPKNSEGSTGGSYTMAAAMAKSLNLVAVYLIRELSVKGFVDFVKNKVGFKANIPEVGAIALGAVDISLFEMLQGYTMFPGRGFNTKPVYITRIEDRNGNILQNFPTEKREVIGETDAYTMVKMMQGVVDFGTAARIRNRFGLKGEIAGKTGTTNDNTDGWFIGYTPQLLAGAWVGCENNFIHFSTTANGQGANTGLPIWAYFFQKVYADKTLGIDPNSTFPIPANMRTDLYLNYDSNMESGAEADDVGNGAADDYGFQEDASGYADQPAENNPPKPAQPANNTPKPAQPATNPPAKPVQQQPATNTPAQQPKATYPPKPGKGN
ncbi:transglycosylase domain-containing protein [Chitinophaga horti]|uniref:Transglycosylase domain-containing protein n=1 Tax=Chitinophaga horti TaxID=2920382 RepID=A0ABY6IWB6_9BACT|nr:transglycosylase domain-containing protein [Chitinophaga horti]UYQ91656.1 transglycosylase domain-containing protein [Chitinophaga horti]